MRLLLADSDPTLTSICEPFFCAEGYEVEVVGDGLQCLHAIRLSVPDLLILEFELPWGGADGVLATLRREFQFAPIDVVVITCSEDSEAELIRKLGTPVCGCLRKPFLLRELSELVRSVTQEAPP